MKKLTENELRNKVVKYLNAKGIPIVLTENNKVIWNYNPHYSNYTIQLSFERKDYNDGISNIIKYYSNINVTGIGRRRTSIADGFCLKVYRTLIWIKEELDKFAEDVKKKIDMKNHYCTELEMYYKKIYSRVSVNATKYQNEIDISINCNDAKSSVHYSMVFKDNKYYLNRKIVDYDVSPYFIIE